MTTDSLPGASLLHCLYWLRTQFLEPGGPGFVQTGRGRLWTPAPVPRAVTQPRAGFRVPSISHSLAIAERSVLSMCGAGTAVPGAQGPCHTMWTGASPLSCRHPRGRSSSPPGSLALSTGQAGSGPRPGRLGPHLVLSREWTPKAPTHSRGVLPSNSVRVPITLLF